MGERLLSALEDWRLVLRVKAGDESAFDAILQRYKRPVLDFVYRMIGDATEAQDVAQDVFVRAYRGIRRPSFRPSRAAFATWLFQVARNAALDCLRRRKRHPASSLSDLNDTGIQIASGDLTPDRAVASGELGQAIARAVGELPEDQRTALVLSEYEDMSAGQIADVMRCSRKSVEGRLYRARRFLRSKLADWMA